MSIAKLLYNSPSPAFIKLKHSTLLQSAYTPSFWVCLGWNLLTPSFVGVVRQFSLTSFTTYQSHCSNPPHHRQHHQPSSPPSNYLYPHWLHHHPLHRNFVKHHQKINENRHLTLDTFQIQ